jgi:hypothetical protein
VSKETEKVRRWRERMKAEGKQAITLWFNRDAVERLNTLAAEEKITVSEFIEQAVTVTQPKVTATVTDTEAEVTATVTDTTAKVTDTVTDTKAVVTDTTAKVTDTVTDTIRKARALTAEELANAAMTLREQGLNWAEIARRWNAEGIPTLTGRGRWHDGNVRRLVKNTARRP